MNICEISVCSMNLLKEKSEAFIFFTSCFISLGRKKGFTYVVKASFSLVCVSPIHFSGSYGYIARGEQNPPMAFILSLELLLTVTEDTHVDCKSVYCSTSVVPISLNIS